MSTEKDTYQKSGTSVVFQKAVKILGKKLLPLFE